MIGYLHAFVKKASIELNKKSEDKKDDANANNNNNNNNVIGNNDSTHSFFKSLGSFALVGLLRVNCLLSDFSGALNCLNPIDLRRHRSIFTQVLSCHVSLYYYMGFAYVMVRRYIDAIKIFSYFLTYASRNKQLINRSHGSLEIVNKRIDQISGLLSIVSTLCNESIEETIMNELKDKYGDQIIRMQRGDLASYQAVFQSCSPKFITSAVPKYDTDASDATDKDGAAVTASPSDEQYALQVKLFQNEIKQRTNIHDIYSYLKLFTTISTAKLAQFLNCDEDTVHSYLLKLKHKTR